MPATARTQSPGMEERFAPAREHLRNSFPSQQYTEIDDATLGRMLDPMVVECRRMTTSELSAAKDAKLRQLTLSGGDESVAAGLAVIEILLADRS